MPSTRPRPARVPLRVPLMILALAACLVLTAAAVHAQTAQTFRASALSQVIARGKLMVGMETEFWPFAYSLPSGEPAGLDVDLARLAASELGVELEIKDMEWTGLIPALEAGKIDLIVSGMTATLTRAKAVAFTEPYFVTGLCALLSNTRAQGVADVAQLNAEGRVLVVKTGTTGDLVAAKRFPKATINRFKDETACVREVVTGRADAFFYDQISIAKHQRENSEATRAILTPFTFEPFAMALRRGDFDFHDWLNMFLATIKADGRLEELRAKHLGQVIPGR